MHYQGGKHILAGDIAKLIMHLHRPGMNYYEPFVGGGSVLHAVRWLPCQKFASDISPDLIVLWKALQAGWIPPDHVSEELYYRLKAQPYPSPMRSFAGFGCSYSGFFFHGYARGVSHGKFENDYSGSAKRGLLRKSAGIAGVSFACCSYLDAPIPPGSIIYCDPPYADTSGYASGNFDSAAFWEWVRLQSRQSVVLVSEYDAPEDFAPVLSMAKRRQARQSREGVITEHVFRYTG